MKKLVYVLGSIALIVIVAAVIGFGIVLYKGHALDAESRAFVDSAVPAITATWSEQQLLDRATPELRDSVKSDELKALFDRLSQLGALVKYEGATGQATMSYIAGSGGTVSASYVAKARFQNGSATFRILLMKREGRWMIHNFHVDSAPGNQARQRTWHAASCAFGRARFLLATDAATRHDTGFGNASTRLSGSAEHRGRVLVLGHRPRHS